MKELIAPTIGVAAVICVALALGLTNAPSAELPGEPEVKDVTQLPTFEVGDGRNSFTLHMDSQTVQTLAITGVGYSKLEGRPYMILEVTGISIDGLTLRIPDTEGAMEVTATSATQDSAVIWALDISAMESVYFPVQEITEETEEEPHQLNITGPVTMSNVTITACYMKAEGVELVNMTQEVVT